MEVSLQNVIAHNIILINYFIYCIKIIINQIKLHYTMNSSLLHICTPALYAILLNFIIYSKKYNYTQQKYPQICTSNLPPGFIIGIVWVIILGLLGYTHHLLYPSRLSLLIMFTMIFILLYPFITKLQYNEYSRLYNILTLILALFISISVHKNTQIYILPFLLWSLYINIIC